MNIIQKQKLKSQMRLFLLILHNLKLTNEPIKFRFKVFVGDKTKDLAKILPIVEQINSHKIL